MIFLNVGRWLLATNYALSKFHPTREPTVVVCPSLSGLRILFCFIYLFFRIMLCKCLQVRQSNILCPTCRFWACFPDKGPTVKNYFRPFFIIIIITIIVFYFIFLIRILNGLESWIFYVENQNFRVIFQFILLWSSLSLSLLLLLLLYYLFVLSFVFTVKYIVIIPCSTSTIIS